jgi:RNA-directed DNA polymerase
MGWLGRFLEWLRGQAAHEKAVAAARGPARAGAPAAEVDPYFADVTDPLIKKSKTLGLDADAFLPISRNEIKQAAQGQRPFANPWFGRRDRIPPADDQRTLLIDRAMATQGLISPETLAEIHRVGDEMELARPSLEGIEHQSQLTAEAAVLADREARSELKARKKAEAAKRRHERQTAIELRRANDIVFLGRGVSTKLSDRTSDPSRLTAAGLPILSTPVELARALGLTIPRLRWLAFHTEAGTVSHYIRFSIPKKSGGTRTLFRPHRTLANAQRWIFENITSILPVEPPAQGFVTGKSILTNAREHAGRALVVNLDLSDFFPSIGFPRVRSVFERAGYSPAVSTILALMCTECPRCVMEYDGAKYHVATGPRGLPQGACTSPSLSNQVAKRFDRRLSGLASKLGVKYTRYADDLTFSGNSELDCRVGYLMARVRHIAQDEGFIVNEAKSRVLRRNAAQVVTGLVVNDRPGVARTEVRRLRAILHRARREGLAQQNREGRPDFVAWLRGKIAFVSMARPEVGAALRADLDAVLGRLRS